MGVTLVGAGPGDKGLLTLKGAERIQKADVVLYDRFVGDEILAMIPEAAEKIYVGKQAGNHSVPQDVINRMLLEKALLGLNVVRLKGGDPFLFGRGGEELELLAENGVDFEVVPGVTSAIAGAAYVGIPVTHREFASSLHIVTGHAKNNEPPDINYWALVEAKGTLIFMMGASAVAEICAGCAAAGMSMDMPAAIVENATTARQRKLVGTVGTLPGLVAEHNIVSPSIVIIGKVCALSERYGWHEKKPLFGRRIVVVRTKPGVSALSESLRDLGCEVTELPPAAFIGLTGPGCDMENVVKNIGAYAWLVFTSIAGVNFFFDYLRDAGYDIRRLSGVKTACVGAETEKAVRARGLMIDYRPDEYNGAALARGLAATAKKGERLLIARAKDGAEDMTKIFKESNINFDDVAIYEKKRAKREFRYTGADCAAFTSSSAVDWFCECADGARFDEIKAVCIGESTAAAARRAGMETFVSDESTIAGMIKKITELYTNERKD